MVGRVLVAVGAGATLLASLSAVAAQSLTDRFRFEFYSSGDQLHIGTDLNSNYYTDFRHNNDYYLRGRVDNPRDHASCSEQTLVGEDGKAFKRVTCVGKPSSPVGQ